ncbi:MAG: hypothetical protein A2Z18_02390, partial [Armatimonadetes bacterium RBG_16_58_9]
MVVLGLTDGITCGAALLQDDVILSALNEERLSRLKMAYGFPRESIREVLRIAGVMPTDVDLVTVATVNNYFLNGLRAFDGWFQEDKGFLRNAVFTTAGKLSYLVDTVPGLESIYYRFRWPVFAARRRAIRRILRSEFGITAPVKFVDHHIAHAASAYFTSGFDDAIVVSMDGGGDGASSHIYEVHDGEFQRIGYTSAYDSLGNYYAYVTHIAGFKAQKHEGKITGLAAHGNPIYLDILDSMITVRDGALKNVGRCVFSGAIRALESRLPRNWDRADLAASIQMHSERVAVEYVKHHLPRHRSVKLAIAGGLFANVRINQKVYEIDNVEEVFVHPGMTDCGLAVGSALTACIGNQPSARRREVIRDVYYGPGYSAEDIQRELRNSGLAYERSKSTPAAVAKLLAEGYVVARFDGRMEYGPRALGNRSILYQPGDRSVNDWLNKQLQRTEFMPFAPSTLMEYAEESYINHEGAQETARFMTITFDCTEQMKTMCPGVVHIDGTARPQLVLREDNPTYYDIIE